ncbi:MAG: aspartate-semialdehyde dehydrogenase [Planctomycetes bacterium]|nr:aspartate-semialdehyde dehydrogenase [Planctomycetota bacterium]
MSSKTPGKAHENSTQAAEAYGWTAAHRAQKVGVVGATGATGLELLDILMAAGHKSENVRAFARRDGALRVRDTDFRVTALARADWDDCDVVFLCTPSDLSRELAPKLVAARLPVIDLSSAYRMQADVPLVVPEINGDVLTRDHLLIANPNCTTAIACLPLAVIEAVCGLAEVIVVSFQAASGAGVPGLKTLQYEMRAAAGVPAAEEKPASPFAAPLALNVIPAIADVGPDGISGEERKVIDETRRILRRPDLVVEVTTTRVPVERCHSVAVHVRTQRDFSLPDLVARMAAAPGISVTDDPHGPRPRECAGTDAVAVGRIRAGTRGKGSLCFFAVGDQIRKGASLNALQVAARLSPRAGGVRGRPA